MEKHEETNTDLGYVLLLAYLLRHGGIFLPQADLEAASSGEFVIVVHNLGEFTAVVPGKRKLEGAVEEHG